MSRKKVILLFILGILVIYIFYKTINKEHFWIWNQPTRYYPSYDLRGYPYINPHHPTPLYLSPYYYGPNGSYNILVTKQRKKHNLKKDNNTFLNFLHYE
jgi:hypothetical protein